MIIDIHTHLGTVENRYHMPIDYQLKAMEKYSVDYAIISDISCGEPYSVGELDLQYKKNKKAIEIITPFKEKLGLMPWCRPNAEGYNKKLEKLIIENRDIIKGLKMHPNISNLAFNDEKYIPYLEIAEKYELPVLVHTKDSPFSKVSFVEEMAKKFKKVNFILGHMNLGGDKAESFRIIKQNPNVYGDTAWVTFEDTEKAIALGLEEKIFFGTDSPISGLDTYKDFYKPYFEKQDKLPLIMSENAKKLFGI